jgi:putative transposase
VVHKDWVEEYLGDGKNIRDDRWTKSIAVGSKGFVEYVKTALGALAKGRKPLKVEEGYQLREPSVSYGGDFGFERVDIGVDNAFLWGINLD